MNGEQGRVRPPGGPLDAKTALPQRINLHHTPPPWVKSGAMFFVTCCCSDRRCDQLCQPALGRALLDSAQHYHGRGDWYLRMILLMPDHVHALVAPAPHKELRRLLGDWKRFATTQHGVIWQKNFFDHRLRSDESWDEKANYIRLNPVRAGLITAGEAWPYLLEN